MWRASHAGMLGVRGQATLFVQCSYSQAMMLVEEVPGVDYGPSGVGIVCTWESLPVVAQKLGRPLPPYDTVQLADMPGHAAYQRLLVARDFEPRWYQVEDAVFLANRPYAFLCNAMRTGKSLTALIGAILADAKRILVLCPSISKWVWGDEIARWLGKEALILSGMSNSRALQYCSVCMSSGFVDGVRCEACKQRNGSTYGYHIHEVRKTEPPKKSEQELGAVLWQCRKHLQFKSKPDEPTPCGHCQDEFIERLATAEIIIGNYDILAGKGYRSASGRVEKKESLPGWERALSVLEFDLAIIDESHMLRGFDTSHRKRGKMLSDRVRRIVSGVPQVWLVTGTPIFGMVRDLYPQLDVATDGLVGSAVNWTERYCEGHAGEYGWVAKGRSNDDELKARLDTIMISRPRSEIDPYLPRKIRRVVYIEPDKGVPRRAPANNSVGTVGKLIDAAAPLKHDAIIANVLPELAEGMKSYILTFRPKHAERIAKLLATKMNSREWRGRMNSVRAEIFVGQTESQVGGKRRRELAQAFCKHEGAAVFIATIRSMPGSISLKGVTSTHFADFDTSPSAMDQAEDRGYERGTTGYMITHYVLRGSIDEAHAAIVIPKFRTKDAVFNDENAQNVLAAFEAERATCDQVMARHEAAFGDMNSDVEDDDWMEI